MSGESPLSISQITERNKMKQSKPVKVKTTIQLSCSFDKAIEYCKQFNLMPEIRKGIAKIDKPAKDSFYTFVTMELVEGIAEVNLFITWEDEDKWQKYWHKNYPCDVVK